MKLREARWQDVRWIEILKLESNDTLFPYRNYKTSDSKKAGSFLVTAVDS
jgi:hypothetical protein